MEPQETNQQIQNQKIRKVLNTGRTERGKNVFYLCIICLIVYYLQLCIKIKQM